MRILIWNWSSRQVAGTESYLHELIPALEEAGHHTAFVCESDEPAERAPIALPATGPRAVIEARGVLPAVLPTWKPEIVLVNGRISDMTERSLLALAPGAYFVHNYHGTCISGLKAHRFPEPVPCSKRFGPACLLHYLPRQCGGRNPLTMLRLYGEERSRLAALDRYAAILTHSEHMRQEYIRHGFESRRVHAFPFLAGSPPAAPDPSPPHDDELRLLFLGRMEELKGGRLLLECLPDASTRLGKRLVLTMAGNGPAKDSWERLARTLQQRHPRLTICFPGWIGEGERHRLLQETHLLVVPSVWPEPFGKVGPEAGFQGVPAAAFRVGGIPDWLEDRGSGALAPGERPEAGELGKAIVWCLEDRERYLALRRRAFEVARRYDRRNHVGHLTAALEFAAGTKEAVG